MNRTIEIIFQSDQEPSILELKNEVVAGLGGSHDVIKETLHRFDHLQVVRRRIPVKLRRVPTDMVLDSGRICFQDEALMRCCQELVTQHQRVDQQSAIERLRRH